MRDGVRREIAERPKRQRHQADKEKHGKTENAVNHFFLRYQVHEKSSHQKRLAARNHERDSDVDFAAGKMNVGGPHREDRANDERDENIQVAPHMMGDMVGMFRMGWFTHKSQ